jgi:hypothetical protein
MLYLNIDPMYVPGGDAREEYWFEPDDRDCATLLYVDATSEVVQAFDESLENHCPGFILLKTSTYGD